MLHNLYVTVPVNPAGSPDEFVRYGINVVAPSLLSPTAGNGAPTPADIVASAQRYAAAYTGVVNPNDCHAIAANVAAAAGATLDYDVTNFYQNPAQNQSAGFWRIAYRGSDPNPAANWQSLLQPGDIVRVGWTDGGKHTFTVVSTSNGVLTVFDNYTGQVSTHAANYAPLVIPSSVTIYRLSPDHLYLINGSNSGETLAGSTYNDLISAGQGNDTIDGGPGTDTVVFAGNRSPYTITDLGNGSIRVVGPDGTDTLTRVERLQFDDQTVTALNHSPTVSLTSGATVSATAAQLIAVSSLFSATDSDGDNLTYYIYDGNSSASSGHFAYNGVALPSQTAVKLTAAELALTTFVAGAAGTSDELGVIVFDGQTYSNNSIFTYLNVNVAGPSVNHAPVITLPSANVAASAGQVIAASSLFSATDSDGDNLTYYIYDGNSSASSGHFAYNGVALPSQTVVKLTAAELALTTFVAGAAGSSDELGVIAFDGQTYSNSSIFTYLDVNVADPSVNHAPVITLPSANVATSAGQVIAASSLFGATDSDGDSLTYYIYDANSSASSGHFAYNGVALPSQTVVGLTTAQLALTTFVAGTAGSSDELRVIAFDGQTYSNDSIFTYLNVGVAGSNTNHAPVITLPSANVAANPGQVIAASSLFGASDSDGDSLTYYIYDANSSASSGHFAYNGVALPSQTVVGLTAAQLALTTFVAGAAGTSDELRVIAFDGQTYSNNSIFTYLNVSSSINSTPLEGVHTVAVPDYLAEHVARASDGHFIV
nr:hypothetical protein [Bradyrhizobium lablabi]